MTDHSLERDTTAWGHHERWTCFGAACNTATCLRAPWMSQAQWDALRNAFVAAHSHHAPATAEPGEDAPEGPASADRREGASGA